MPAPKRKTTNTAIFFAIASLLLPSVALAQVKITEVMYDAPGADSGHEWVEVANVGSQNVDIGKYKLSENGTNHSLKLTQGSSVLSPGSTAIIANDASKFLADYPAFSSSLFDSTFSLSNTGETLTLKDASSSLVDSISYSASADANGTGGTLNLNADQWVAAIASPGIFPSPLSPVPKAPAAQKPAAAKKTTSTSPSKNSAKQGSSSSASASLYGGVQDSNAASLSLVPKLSGSMLVGLGLVAVVLLGVAGVFFLMQGKHETSLTAEEFNIE